MDKTDKNAIALLNRYPNAKFSVGDTYDSLNWKDEEISKPTEEEFNNAIKAYDAQEYARTRAPLYPNIGDQLDDLYKKGAFSDEMAAKIKKVKDDNPKPS